MKSGSLFNRTMNTNSWGTANNNSSNNGSQSLFKQAVNTNFARSIGGGGSGSSGSVVGQSIMGFNKNNQGSLFNSQPSSGRFIYFFIIKLLGLFKSNTNANGASSGRLFS